MTRNLLGSLVLAGLLLALWRLAPAAVSAYRAEAESETQRIAAAQLAQPAQPACSQPLRALFIGNSHTYYNAMPALVEQLARAAHETRCFVFTLEAPGGASLAEHLAGPKVRELIQHGPWDFVVLQEQQQRPSFTFNAQQLEREFYAPARTLDVLIRVASAKTVLYMTWARRDGDPPNVPGDTYEAMQERTRQSYMHLAQELDALVAPAGLAWRWVRQQRPELPLWQPDGSHPTLAGSYLAACVLYAAFYGHSALDNPFHAGLPDDQAALLQRAAEVARHL